ALMKEDEAPDLEPLPVPELCDWLHSVDDVLWGRLDEVQAVTDMFVFPVSGRSHELITGECEVLDPALDLYLEVEGSARGAVANGEVVAARVGRYQWDEWTTKPELVRGSLGWNGEDALEEGQWLGLAVHWVEERCGLSWASLCFTRPKRPTWEGKRLWYSRLGPMMNAAFPGLQISLGIPFRVLPLLRSHVSQGRRPRNGAKRVGLSGATVPRST
ncbi:MAG: hypothetical protein ACOCVR_00220, partial [Myxococcota bacterium]